MRSAAFQQGGRGTPWLAKARSRPVWLAAHFMLPLLLCLVAPVQQAASSGRGAGYFPNVPLTTHDGRSVRFYDDLISEKVVVINFIFTTCPDSCPAETAKLRQVQRELGARVGDDIFMYSISIDPEHDTPEVLAEYRDKFDLAPGWIFLTGKEDDIILLRKKLGLYMEEIQSDDGDHNLSFIVGNDSTGKWIKRSPFDDPRVLAKLIGYDLFEGQVPRIGAKSYRDVPAAPEFSTASYLFRTRCESCHTIGGGETRLGPDLIGIGERRSRDWLVRWIKEPDKMIQEGDPEALELFERYQRIAMPNLRLEDEQVDALIDYIDQESRALRRRLAATQETPTRP
jgi:protein SCO1/2